MAVDDIQTRCAIRASNGLPCADAGAEAAALPFGGM